MEKALVKKNNHKTMATKKPKGRKPTKAKRSSRRAAEKKNSTASVVLILISIAFVSGALLYAQYVDSAADVKVAVMQQQCEAKDSVLTARMEQRVGDAESRAELAELLLSDAADKLHQSKRRVKRAEYSRDSLKIKVHEHEGAEIERKVHEEYATRNLQRTEYFEFDPNANFHLDSIKEY